ncbi:MAG: hypothetical protein LAT82_01975 [Nanoarchaeota archaeon]|nr:hypothetical protein [Nanoarchaeota archaeon]
MESENLELPIITFNSLYNVLREEEKTATLNTLPKHFFKAVEIFLKEKKKESDKTDSNIKIKNMYHNSVKMYQKLLKVRGKKIAILAIDTLSSKQVEEELVDVEIEFKNNVIKLFEKTYNYK